VNLSRLGDATIDSIYGDPCTIGFNFSGTDDNNEAIVGTATCVWYSGQTRVATQQIPMGNGSFDITPYLHTGTNEIRMTASVTVDGQSYSRTKNWIVNVVRFALEWDYDETTINSGSNLVFDFIPRGDLDKTLHIKIDGTEVLTQAITVDGVSSRATVNNTYQHGSHTAELYLTAVINGTTKDSNHIKHDMLIVNPASSDIIIASTLQSNDVDQYNTTVIPFTIYDPQHTFVTVELLEDGDLLDTRTNVDRT